MIRVVLSTPPSEVKGCTKDGQSVTISSPIERAIMARAVTPTAIWQVGHSLGHCCRFGADLLFAIRARLRADRWRPPAQPPLVYHHTVDQRDHPSHPAPTGILHEEQGRLLAWLAHRSGGLGCLLVDCHKVVALVTMHTPSAPLSRGAFLCLSLSMTF